MGVVCRKCCLFDNEGPSQRMKKKKMRKKKMMMMMMMKFDQEGGSYYLVWDGVHVDVTAVDWGKCQSMQPVSLLL